MWKLIQNKTARGQQDIKVAIIVKEMAVNTYASYAEAFENHFKIRLKEISRTNNYSAELFYIIKTINLKNIEVWKVDVFGDLKHKMFTLEYIENVAS